MKTIRYLVWLMVIVGVVVSCDVTVGADSIGEVKEVEVLFRN